MTGIFKNSVWLIILLCFGLPLNTVSQTQNCNLRVSLLTCSPGEELYSTFGHSALRVIDSTDSLDIVFNYGTFNFDEPNFYIKFARGKLKYFVSVEYYDSFAEDLKLENRSITEQLLNLTCDEKQRLKEYLQWNLMPPNKYYKYDFTFDNCTTRLRDIIEKITGDSLLFHPFLSKPSTFRNAIHEYLNQNEKAWSRLGIDILLGSRLDKTMTSYEAMFLPDNLMRGLDSAGLRNTPLVTDKEVILKNHYIPHTHNGITGPFFIFSCLFVIIAFLSFSTNKKIKRFLASLDGVLFFLNGALGILLLFMWFGTDHYMTKGNYNLLITWPTNILAAFFIHSPRRWAKIYFIIFALAQILLLCFWFFLPQSMNIALIPIVGILVFRSFLYNPLNKYLDGRDQVQK